MPTAASILDWATAVANDWRELAIAWHIALAALLIAVARGSSASPRFVAHLLVLPVVSVSILAWASWNPFNGLAFAALAVMLACAARHLSRTPVTRASAGWVSAGAALVALGWAYPEFLRTETWTAYAYASPFGLLPCPTLLVLLGITLIVGGLHSLAWGLPLVGAGVLYGVIGVVGLRVSLDVWLLAGASLLGLMLAADLAGQRVRATDDERTNTLPGDELLTGAVETLTHAVAIDAAPSAVWPWLVQMGAGSRAGWYSYDFFDNGRHPSASQIIPELQQIAVGTLFPALPGASEGFIVEAFRPLRWLILGWPNADGSPAVTWAFVLEQRRGGSTRLIVRARAGRGYRFHGLPVWLSTRVVRLVHFVMQRKQLLGIAGRVSASSAVMPDAA